MAMIVYTCVVCGRKGQIAVSSGCVAPSLCTGCKKLESDCTRREHFHGLDGLTVEERLRKIERWIYDYKPHVNPTSIRY